MGQRLSCCGCGPRHHNVESNYSNLKNLPQVEDDSWKKYSSYTLHKAAMLSDDQAYAPPRYVGQFSAEAAWEL
ncbi:hypothetical protein H257_06979 [Aphanomyces astaci]|uniref:Uncharacterized protein n=1 Tax=Aphanomyces astaci TaxID=112090 RepID=W4GLG7_APHAT|nr:hypothetical protein H257_06979 [Aphanomyces astaci]ETV79748.1 hypothetical protein H257_06979 [Aphanomyces astaci]|eukprot:XP_009830684.1 hypothetical protein H257_06979 [Aphanomyces astaci]